MAVKTDPTESLRRVPIFGGLDKKELETVATMGPGQFFGEIAVLDGGPRTADVRADADTVCLTLVSWEIKPVLMENAAISYKMLLETVKRLRSQEPRPQD